MVPCRAPASRGEETGRRDGPGRSSRQVLTCPAVMEDQLELVAMSLRGDQDEAEGVRKGLLMLQVPLMRADGSDCENFTAIP